MSGSEKPIKAFTLSLIAGVLIILNATALGAAATWFPWIIPTIPGTSNDTVPFIGLTTVGLICGALVLLSSLMLKIKPSNKKAWGAIIIVFSVPALIMGGGFIIGFILGIIGGKSVFSKKPKTQSAN